MKIVKTNGISIEIKNRIGLRYGFLTVIEYGGVENNKTKWICKCDCGKIKIVFSEALKKQKSCGCLLKGNGIKTHGLTKSTYYSTWKHMKKRCFDKNNPQYKDYGGRGITVCDRWLNSFENFYADMGPKPSSEYTLERVNNNGNYTPENCKWADRMAQSWNRRNSVVLCNFETGIFYSLSEASRLKVNKLVRV